LRSTVTAASRAEWGIADVDRDAHVGDWGKAVDGVDF
jgi:hypothetical protein